MHDQGFGNCAESDRLRTFSLHPSRSRRHWRAVPAAILNLEILLLGLGRLRCRKGERGVGINGFRDNWTGSCTGIGSLG